MASRQFSRRHFLGASVLAFGVSPILAACQQAAPAPSTPQVVKEVVTQVVEKQVTQVVEKQVTQVVEKQVVVTATPAAAPAAPPTKVAGKPAAKQELTIFFQAYTDFSPHRDGGIGMYHGQLTNAGLLNVDDDGKPQPFVAESWSASSDNLVYTFKIRQDLKFAPTGRPVKAIDIKNCLQFICQNLASWMPDTYMPMVKGAQASYKQAQSSVKAGSNQVAPLVDIPGFVAKDDYTFEVHLDYPSPAFIPFVATNTLSGWTIFDYEQTKLDTPDKRWDANGAGSVGPYMFKSFDATSGDIVMVPNPYYVLGPKPKLTQITWKKVPDAQTRLIAYQNGTVDYIWSVAPADAKQIASPSHPLNKELKIWPATAYWWWGLNLDKEPFNDLNFRKAVALSIDFKKAHDVVFGPLATLATSVIPGGPYHRDDLFPKYYTFDQAAAKAAFKDSKYGGDPKKVPPVTFGVSTGYSDHLLWAQVVQQMVKQSIGVSMQITAKDTFSPDERKGIDILSQSWGSATLDPSEWTWQITPQVGDVTNFGYPPQSQKAKTDEWKKIIDTNFDEDARKKAYFAAEENLASNYYTLLGYYSPWVTLLKPWVKNFRYISNWTLVHTDDIFIEEH